MAISHIATLNPGEGDQLGSSLQYGVNKQQPVTEDPIGRGGFKDAQTFVAQLLKLDVNESQKIHAAKSGVYQGYSSCFTCGKGYFGEEE